MLQMNTALRNALVSQIEIITGPNAKIEVRSGPQPANCGAADTGTLLVTFPLGPDWSTQTGGVLTFSSVPVSTPASGNGLAAHYRMKDSTATTCTMQGTCTATGGGGDLTVDNPNISGGQTVQITGWTITAPGA
jgi:hypothetical protein